MRPKKQKNIEFVNECECIFDSEMLAKAMIWFADGTLKSPRKIYLHGRYPCVSIYDKKIHVHRLLGLYLFRDKLIDGVVVHHKDHNRLNAMPNNLKPIPSSIHVSHHNKGRIFSEQHKKKISIANQKRKGMKLKKRVHAPIDGIKKYLKDGRSINEIAKIYNCDWSTIKSRINENPELCSSK